MSGVNLNTSYLSGSVRESVSLKFGEVLSSPHKTSRERPVNNGTVVSRMYDEGKREGK